MRTVCPGLGAIEGLKLGNGRSVIGLSHDYTRNGTTTLFDAWTWRRGRSQASITSAAGASSDLIT